MPLVLDADGRRLAKRDGATTLAGLAEAGVPASDVVGWIIDSLGMPSAGPPTLASVEDLSLNVGTNVFVLIKSVTFDASPT